MSVIKSHLSYMISSRSVLFLCVCITFLLSPRRLLAAKLSNSPGNASWQLHSLVGMEVGPTGAQFSYSDTNDARYCSRLSGAQIVRNCAQAGAEYVVVWARD